MSVLDKLIYGIDPQLSFFIYNRLPLFLLLTAGIFIMVYLMMVSIFKTPHPAAIFASVIFAAAASFLLLTSTMINFIYRNINVLGFMGQGVGIAIFLVLAGFVLYMTLK